MKVAITGHIGFIGYHLSTWLGRREGVTVVPVDDAAFADPATLARAIGGCDTVVHLAAMNRGDSDELYRTNIGLVETLIAAASLAGGGQHILFSSSIQERLDNPYGNSKREGRLRLETWARNGGGNATTMVIPNVFGPFGRPRYNSVVATFCHQLTHDEEPKILVDSEVRLIPVTSLVRHFESAIRTPGSSPVRVIDVPEDAVRSVSSLLAQITMFRDVYKASAVIPPLPTPFDVALFNTYRSYLEPGHFPFALQKRTDNRGYLVENLRTNTPGQVFFSVTLPGITRGNHFHFRKVERFCVLSGEGTIRLRRVGTPDVVTYTVSGDNPVIVDMPVCTTHNIQNTGSTEMLTMFWSNEFFNPDDSDTYPEAVA